MVREQSTPQPQDADAFDWPLATEAEGLLRNILAAFLAGNSFARRLAERMRHETGTDFFEWIDHFALGPEHEESLRASGFMPETGCETPDTQPVLAHPRATLPRIRLHGGQAHEPVIVALRPESIAEFVRCHDLRTEIVGEPYSRYRRVIVAREQGTSLKAVERHAYQGFVDGPLSAAELRAVIRARELWQTRPRRFGDEAEGFETADEILTTVTSLVGTARACQYFFEEERRYWESRNHAARFQKHRQDRLGLGWGNHDHHTFRCSRRHFADLIRFFLRLDFQKRERFYAGAEAGWGAQILEHPVTGIVVFADVDLLPEETALDFPSVPLPDTSSLGTVGLWVALHGESFLQAGMHHLEARFDFDRLRDQLKTNGLSVMAPFSDFQFLRQAFTEGERWPVAAERLEALVKANLITDEQADRFRREGAIGSHLENLQRHGGFKGFNQRSVSVIIAATDPRKEHFHA